MSGPDDSAEKLDPRLTEEDRRSLARMRRVEAEAKAAGRWKTKPPFEDTDKFDGSFGVDAEGNVLIYPTKEEARAAAAERERRRRAEAERHRRAEARALAAEFERWLLESAVVHPRERIRAAAAEYERRFLESPVLDRAFEKGQEVAREHYHRWLESSERITREQMGAMQDEYERLWRERTDFCRRAEARDAASEYERRWRESVAGQPNESPPEPGKPG